MMDLRDQKDLTILDVKFNYAGLGPDSGYLVLFTILGMQKLKIRLSYG